MATTCLSSRTRSGPRRPAFTLVEVMLATALTLLLMAMVVTVFATVTDTISFNRAAIETNDQVRSITSLLQGDLGGATARALPPLRPESDEGYIEIIEGPIGPVFLLSEASPVDSADRRLGYNFLTATPVPGFGSLPNNLETRMPAMWLDGTHGDSDDVLMLTTRNLVAPFRGRVAGSQSYSSTVAEVCWFLRGTTLYRRVLLVAPGIESRMPDAELTSLGFYARNDLSVRQAGGAYDAYDPSGEGLSPPDPRLALNSLGDLTKRENRYGHQPHLFPHDARGWGRLGLPTLKECTYHTDVTDLTTATWPFPLHRPGAAGTLFTVVGSAPYAGILPRSVDATTFLALDSVNGSVVGLSVDSARGDGFDAWSNPHPWQQVDAQTGTLLAYHAVPGDTSGAGSLRSAEDVVLNNVLAFDIKVWDPGAPVLERVMANNATKAILPGDPGYLQQLIAVLSGAEDPDVVRVARFGAYVDLNYLCRAGTGALSLGAGPYGSEYVLNTALIPPTGIPQSQFGGPGIPRSGQMGTEPSTTPGWGDIRAAVYDTWSTHYESDGYDQDDDGVFDEGTDGFDNDVDGYAPPADPPNAVNENLTTSLGRGVNGVDDLTELEAPPPYPHPLRGIQIKIRVFEPDTRQIREVTVVQDFVTQ